MSALSYIPIYSLLSILFIPIEITWPLKSLWITVVFFKLTSLSQHLFFFIYSTGRKMFLKCECIHVIFLSILFQWLPTGLRKMFAIYIIHNVQTVINLYTVQKTKNSLSSINWIPVSCHYHFEVWPHRWFHVICYSTFGCVCSYSHIKICSFAW